MMSRALIAICAAAVVAGCTSEPPELPHKPVTGSEQYAYGWLEGRCDLMQQIGAHDPTYASAAAQICATTKADELRVQAVWSMAR